MSTQPLVQMIDESKLTPEVKQIFEQMKVKNGQVPKWMKVMANCEDIFLGFFKMFQASMDDNPLDNKIKWKVGMHVSDINKCEFCTSIADQKLRALGCENAECMTEDQLTDREKIAFAYAKQVTEHAYKIDSELIEQLKQTFTDEELVELTAVITLFNYINRFNDALRILPD
ncbi:MAG: hypothetical protein U9O78_01525 [Patescibacteria group bacterium]|nr:hypothetical protein [Patescibacteria group bacterium]